MPNIKQNINSHNKIILDAFGAKDPPNAPNIPKKDCNCRTEANCPLGGNCLVESLVYQAKIDNENYIGLTSGPFKQRFNGHKSSFANKSKEHETKLSKYYWELKDKGIDPKVEWKIVTFAPSYSPLIGRCILCLREKEQILFYKDQATLNNRNEVASACRHSRKFKLL